MNRGKKIILLCHCILNANAKVEGLADYPGALKELVTFLIERDIAMIQLPCPETEFLGVQRWGHVKDQLSYPYFTEACEKLLFPFLRQVEMYQKQGYSVIGVIGIDGSPCCGVTKTCRSRRWAGDFLDPELTWNKIEDLKWVEEPGIFMEIFQKMSAERSLNVAFFNLDESNAEASIPKLIESLTDALEVI